jgi:N-methylhydantoinase A
MRGTVTTAIRVGADIGGTFTDVTLIDAQGDMHRSKVLTTHHDPASAVLQGLQQVVAAAQVEIGRVETIIHGTTLVINALIERRGAKTALVCTEGFRDILDIANENRYDIYDLLIERPTPLVPPALRYPLPERIYSDGSVVTPLAASAVRALIPAWRREQVQAVAVCLLHSYKNPQHERMVAEILRHEAPELYLTLSSDLVPEIREYPRTSTTVANVFVRPVIEQYLRSLENSLRRLGFRGQFLIMLSNGGTCTVETACQYPIYILESGPAAGALAAVYYGQQTAFPALLSFDMGGTTAKSCLIDGGKPMTTTDYEVARVYRFKKGSGLPIKVPVIEMIEIGAGGGSIARVDTLGLLKVGPDSAESHPGPVCYCLGGQAPTVTDADLVLGYLDAGFFLGGQMRLDAAAAYQAIAEQIATPLGLEPVAAAWGMHQVVNENMASAARVHAIERGKDPRSYALFAFGGAGPVHAWHVAQILDMTHVICPMGAGVASAFGMLCAPLAFDFVRSYYATLATLDWAHANALLDSMEAEGRQLMQAAGVAPAAMTVSRRCEMRYAGQTHEIAVPLPPGLLGAERTVALLAAFEAAYNALYTEVQEGRAVETLNWRLTVSGPRPQVYMETATTQRVQVQAKGERPVYFPSGGFRPTPVYDRYALPVGTRVVGPAIVEERECTAVIAPGFTAEVDRFANLIMRRGEV